MQKITNPNNISTRQEDANFTKKAELLPRFARDIPLNKPKKAAMLMKIRNNPIHFAKSISSRLHSISPHIIESVQTDREQTTGFDFSPTVTRSGKGRMRSFSDRILHLLATYAVMEYHQQLQENQSEPE